MPRLAYAAASLLSANLLAEAIRALWRSGVLPPFNLLLLVLVVLGMVALVWFATLEASPRWYEYEREAKVCAIAGLVGALLVFV
ncbi:hypothetical protein [Stenomitos frigidus]|uniref:Uncharacterized protein n=1 Tax=Stenomitos frigidus ULC18 TaxID=2107698 RepID=A0A2T1E1K6_9CYAN|nr:hypothetical protein [Stenomitos frigidus]PSB26653.1 hypothetical protein C7B82_19300 [Stenomitos frigidus ULC18]